MPYAYIVKKNFQNIAKWYFKIFCDVLGNLWDVASLITDNKNK
jgi:hypothetical protein